MPVGLVLVRSPSCSDVSVGLPLHLSPGPRRPGHRQAPAVRPYCRALSAPVRGWSNSGNFALLPLRTRTRGPAYSLPALPPNTSDLDIDPDSESYDPLDEVLSLFRANTFFRNFEIKGPADRLLIYGILFVSECLGKVKPSMGKREAEKVCISLQSIWGISMWLDRWAKESYCWHEFRETGAFERSVGPICYTGRC